MIDLQHIIHYQTFTWPAYEALSIEDNTVIAKFLKKIYQEGVFEEIEKLMTCKEFKKTINGCDYYCVGIGHTVLLAICSAIDSLGAFAEGIGRNRVKFRFISFIKSYFPDSYDENIANKIYEAFRCGSTHAWYLFSGNMIGLINYPNHLKEENGIMHISLNDFFNDLKIAFRNYYEDIQKDNDIKDKLLRRYQVLKG